MKHVKLFEEFNNNSIMTINLQSEVPELVSRETRIENDDPQERKLYTKNITTTLDVFKVEDKKFKRETGSYVHESFKKSGVTKLKLVYKDSEKGYGTYGPDGGSHEVTVYAGVKNDSKEDIVKLFKTLWEDDVFNY